MTHESHMRDVFDVDPPKPKPPSRRSDGSCIGSCQSRVLPRCEPACIKRCDDFVNGDIERRPATVREDWERPTGTCPECGAEKRIFAVFDADELSLLLDCPSECLVDPTPVAWPWADDFFARPAECKALGFEVV